MLEKKSGALRLTRILIKISQMTKIYSLITLFLILLCNDALAQFAKYSNEFLNIGAGARGMSMGNAQVASVTDGTSGYWNPAGLVNVKDNPQLNLMHAEYFAGIGKYDYANLVLPLKDNKRTLGLTFLRFAVDDIPNTVFLVQPDGSINFSNITTFSSADYAFIFSLAQQVNWQKNKKDKFRCQCKNHSSQGRRFCQCMGFWI